MNGAVQGSFADGTIAAAFERQVALTPDAIAVVSGDHQLTYRELNARANKLARYLQAAGAAPDTLVGLAVERSHEMMIALLAILKSGAAYMPLDPGYPGARIAFTIEDSKTSLILTTENIRAVLPDNSARMISLDRDADAIAKESDAPVVSQATGRNLAYVMYTSGSTGKPKGVMIEQHNVINFFDGMDTAIGRIPGTWLAVTSVCFDISVLELLWTVARGFKVVVHRPDGQLEVPTEIRKHGVTHFQSTPSLTRALAVDPDARAALGTLKQLLLGGEALPASMIGMLRPEYKGEIFNMYGPTETTIWSTTYQVHGVEEAMPIGRPILNTQIYVLDTNGQPVPQGDIGELFIAGDGVARGYLFRPELTAERFLDDPFIPGNRMYKTGDLARVRADGQLEYLGRTDFQVKIRGFRIELGEIEAQLEQQPGVQQAVVNACEDKGGDKLLVAYVVAKADQPASAEALRNALASKLPPYMMPSQFLFLDKFPLTDNGKIDRKSLPAIQVQNATAETSAESELDGELEEMVAAIWAEALGIPQVRANDNFFDLGGHSLSALKAAFKLQQVFQMEFPLQTFIQTPVLREQARLLEEMILNAAEVGSSQAAN
jgi:amino acid adenylation domain-containing protein